MKKGINPKIIDAINKNENNSAVIELLITLLRYENEISEMQRPKYGEYYDKQIKKYTQKWIDLP
ncbi:MAG: hypothetical protein Q8M06_02160 [Methanobacteriaceae archaeon]|nr:hypothetical protein [Methanobacteriaceae archaeon]